MPGCDVAMRIDIDARRDSYQHVLYPAAALAESRESFGIVTPVEHNQASIRGNRGQ